MFNEIRRVRFDHRWNERWKFSKDRYRRIKKKGKKKGRKEKEEEKKTHQTFDPTLFYPLFMHRRCVVKQEGNTSKPLLRISLAIVQHVARSHFPGHLRNRFYEPSFYSAISQSLGNRFIERTPYAAASTPVFE